MATPKIIADFETQLATSLAIGDTSFTLASATDDDGVALPNGLYYFTVDNGTSNKEYLAGTLTGTSVASVLSVSRQGTETSGAVRAHRVGSTVIMTDFATYMKYMNEIALVSAPDASTIAKGVVEAATLAEVRARTGTGGTGAKLVVTPDVMDDLPTSDQKAALAGGGSFGTPATGNKFITEDYIDAVQKIDIFTASGTWTKPTGAKFVEVLLIGAGGGGGSGSADNSPTYGSGGAGGGGGGFTQVKFNASTLSATETVTAGAGGAGGVAPSNNGSAGTDTSFGTKATAKAGTGGTTGANNGLSTGGGTGGSGLTENGGDGGNGQGPSAGTGTKFGAATGGGGGGSAAGGSTGGAGGAKSLQTHAGGTGGASANAGGAGVLFDAEEPIGGTGGGGAGASNGVNTTGGAGGLYGGGGGGGGSYTGINYGNGGSGANGICVVITYM